MTSKTDALGVAESFLGRFTTGDFEGAGILLDPEVEMRVLPGGPQKYHGREQVIGRIKLWLGTGDDIQATHAEARAVEDRIELAHGFRILNAVQGAKPGWHAIEQRAFCDAGTMIEHIDLVCSGFRPIIEAGSYETLVSAYADFSQKP